MTEQHVHIVSFNIPYPPDYGGVIDVYYKIKSLSEIGVKVHLHCFQYGREETEVLNTICETVNYYPRRNFYSAIYSKVPYIVGSRTSEELLSNLLEDKHPILFEGLHTCFYIDRPDLQDRIRLIRMHNVEWDYYRSLGKAERNFFRKFYFYQESKKLKAFEDKMDKATSVLAISRKDNEYLSEKHDNVKYIPAFHPNQSVDILTGRGNYALYHGNLSVIENNQAAIYLLKKVFAEMPNVNFKIAGREPLSSLKRAIKEYSNVELIENPSDEVLNLLIKNAHINLLPTFQATGIKLKLLNALHIGRFCVVNTRMVQNTGLEDICIVENDSSKMRAIVSDLLEQDFDESEIKRREAALGEHFSNTNNANKLAKILFPAQ